MATSLESKRNELEARLKARNGVSGGDHIPADVSSSTNSPAPRRPKPCQFFSEINLNFDQWMLFTKISPASSVIKVSLVSLRTVILAVQQLH